MKQGPGSVLGTDCSGPSCLATPGLFSWQMNLMAYILGLLSLEYWPAALAGFFALWLMCREMLGRRVRIMILGLCFIVGLGHVWMRMPSPPSILPDWMEKGEKVRVHGTVFQVRSRPENKLRVILDQVSCTLPDGRDAVLPGKLNWTWEKPLYRPFKGQSIELEVRVKPIRWFGNPGLWDYELYWQCRGVFFRTYTRGGKGVLNTARSGDNDLRSYRDLVVDALVNALPKTQGGAMVLALMTGDRFNLEQETIDNMRMAGLSHTLALSGLHLGFVAGIGVGLAWLVGIFRPGVYLRLPRPKLAVIFAAPLVLAYLWLGQCAPSLVRAACMFGFWGALLLMNRGRVLLDGLFWALALILLIFPLSAYDLGLQLSAVAVAGIGVFYPKLRYRFSISGGYGKRFLSACLSLLVLTLCANLALLPLSAWYFGNVTPNLLTNVVWLPLLGIIVMPFGFLGMACTCLPGLAGAGSLLLSVSSSVLDVMLLGLQQLADGGFLPIISVLRPHWPTLLGYGLILIVLATLGVERKIPWKTLLLASVLLFAPSVQAAFQDMRHEVRLTLVDVGQGQSVIVTAPGGVRCLIDGGGFRSRTFDIGEAVVGPCLTWGRPPVLEAMALSHSHIDHYGGLLHPLNKFQVGRFLTNGNLPGGWYGDRFKDVLREKGMRLETLRTGDVLELGSGVCLVVVHPDREFRSTNANNRSLVFRLEWNGKPLALIPGDIEETAVNTILESGEVITAQILVLPHHGAKPTLAPGFVDRVSPQTVLCSCGYLNKFGFPLIEVRQLLVDHGCSLFTTANDGMISVVWRKKLGSPHVSEIVQ